MHFSAFRPSVAFDRFVPVESSPQNGKTAYLPNLAKMLGADDISVFASFPGCSSWVTVYEGQHGFEVGIDTDNCTNPTMRGGFSEKAAETRWLRLASAGPRHALLVTSLRGSGGEYFVVALLFNISTESGQRCAEQIVREATPVMLSVVELCLQVTQLQARVDGSNAALDRLDVGIIFLNSDCDILYENGIAGRLLDRGAGVRRRGQWLIATDLIDAVRLRVAIEHVVGSPYDRKKQVPLLTLKRGNGQRPLLASVLPAGANHDSASDVSLVIFLVDPDREIGHLIRSACQLYALSPVETELSCRLACGESIAEAAATLKIKELTARGYLKQIFVKTGVNRQAALVQLLLSSIIHLGDSPELLVM